VRDPGREQWATGGALRRIAKQKYSDIQDGTGQDKYRVTNAKTIKGKRTSAPYGRVIAPAEPRVGGGEGCDPNARRTQLEKIKDREGPHREPRTPDTSCKGTWFQKLRKGSGLRVGEDSQAWGRLLIQQGKRGERRRSGTSERVDESRGGTGVAGTEGRVRPRGDKGTGREYAKVCSRSETWARSCAQKGKETSTQKVEGSRSALPRKITCLRQLRPDRSRIKG